MEAKIKKSQSNEFAALAEASGIVFKPYLYSRHIQAKKATQRCEAAEKAIKTMEHELARESNGHQAMVHALETSLDELRRKNSALDCRVKELQASTMMNSSLKPLNFSIAHELRPKSFDVSMTKVSVDECIASRCSYSNKADIAAPVVAETPVVVPAPAASTKSQPQYFGTRPPFAYEEPEPASLGFTTDASRLDEITRRNVRTAFINRGGSALILCHFRNCSSPICATSMPWSCRKRHLIGPRPSLPSR